METRKKNNAYKKIAEDLIKKEPLLEHIKDSNLRIVYLESDNQKKIATSFICGECEKIPDKYKWAINADFSIVLYYPNIVEFTAEQLKILLYHELLHIGINEKGKPYVVPHDVEDFDDIISRYGTHWNSKK